MSTLSNCKTGSAWHQWQIAGRTWRQFNQDASREDMLQAADIYAGLVTHENGRICRRRAFIEGANNAKQAQ